jgi:iron complex outermembrane recepter protein
MLGRIALTLISAWPLTLAGPAFAQTQAVSLRIEGGSLQEALQDLQRQTGIELLFDPSLIAGREAPSVAGNLTTDAALRQLLAGTGLTVRRASSGAWIVERANAAPLEQQDADVPEIIVIGRRTQNADIRRVETDVQPYVVLTAEEIRSAHRDNIDQIFNSRVTANTTVVPPGWGQGAGTSSSIDLRGLGTAQTLVLVDGRRMPSSPATLAFDQSDLNAMPLHGIERIEILTGAAGGIYGFGALGGVVNVVIDREHRGFDLYLTQGVSSRGDARQQGIEASYGYTSPDDDTDFTVFASHTESGRLLVGDRSFSARDRRRTYANIPSTYLDPLSFNLPYGNSVTIVSSFGEELELKSEFGGATLGAPFTFLPVGFSGSQSDLGTALSERAGQVDFSLAADNRDADLGSNPHFDSLLINVRHRFGDALEVYADAAILSGRGESHDPTQEGDAFIGPDSPVNPFNNYIDISFPVEGGGVMYNERIENIRYTAGLLTDLPFEWRGSAEASWGGYRVRTSHENTYSYTALFLGLFGDPSDLDTNPFGDWETFQNALNQDIVVNTFGYEVSTRFRNESVRLAGPVFNTDAGLATLTLLAEHRSEDGPSFLLHETSDSGTGPVPSETFFGAFSTDTRSLYAELRAPIFDETAPSPLLRGLEIQLAARRDEQTNSFPHDLFDPSSSPAEVSFDETTYTAGLKVAPAPWLLLRGSFATGRQPPALENMQTLEDWTIDFGIAFDPRRGDMLVGDEVPFTLKWGGSRELDTILAESLSLGAIFMPFGEDGARLTIDYSRIRRTGDIIVVEWDALLAHEDEMPGRVERGPLTDDDIALGYTGGPVTMLDIRPANRGSLEVDTIDARVEWPMTFQGGRLRLYAEASNQMRNVVRELFRRESPRVGYFGGPLTWRANGGFDWTRDGLTLGANLQYFSSYSVLRRGLDLQVIQGEEMAAAQGSADIPAQTYLDLHASWQLPFGGHDVTIDFGVINVLDTEPARETTFRGITSLNDGPGYSRYGDPRQRRFELVLSSHF